MAITYTWEFPSHTRLPSKLGKQNVVETVHWRLNATDGVNAVSTYGSVTLDIPPDTGFVDFEDISKEDIQVWVENKMNSFEAGPGGKVNRNVESLKNGLAGQLSAMADPNKPISESFNF